MAAIPNPKVPQVFPQVLAEDDIKKLIQTAKRKPRDLALVLVLLDTGIRASECCNLSLGDVDIDSRSLLIRNGKGQNKGTCFSQIRRLAPSHGGWSIDLPTPLTTPYSSRRRPARE